MLLSLACFYSACNKFPFLWNETHEVLYSKCLFWILENITFFSISGIKNRYSSFLWLKNNALKWFSVTCNSLFWIPSLRLQVFWPTVKNTICLRIFPALSEEFLWIKFNILLKFYFTGCWPYQFPLNSTWY